MGQDDFNRKARGGRKEKAAKILLSLRPSRALRLGALLTRGPSSPPWQSASQPSPRDASAFRRFITIDNTVILVGLAHRPQRFVIQAGQSQAFFQFFGELLQGFKMIGGTPEFRSSQSSETADTRD